MNHDTPPENIQQSAAHQTLKLALPLASFVALIASVLTYLTFPQPTIRPILATQLFVLSLLHIACARLWLPHVQSSRQQDWVVLMLFVISEFCNQIASGTTPIATGMGSGLLVMMTSFVIIDHGKFLLFVAFVTVGNGLSRYLTGLEIGRDYISFASIVVIFGCLTRYSVSYMQHEIAAARRNLSDKVNELITEKKLREDSEKQLIHAQKMEGLGLLATGVAHDFNNYLHVINGMAELIEKEQPSRHTHQIRDVVRRASDVCQKMLAYAGKPQDQVSAVDIVECIRQMEPVLVAGLNKNIRLSLELPRLPLYAVVNQTRLQQCLTNLVHNAADAISSQSEHGDVTISVWSSSGNDKSETWRHFGAPVPDKAVNIEVCDTGSGMEPGILERAFDPYFTTKPTGHGFGLSTTLGIIRSFGGAIRCWTMPGQGTRMCLRLPRTEATGLNTAQVRDRVKRPTHLNILLVDDEQSVLETIAALMQANGWKVRSASSAIQAWTILLTADSAFDVALVDYAMPEMNGVDLLNQVRSAGIPLPFILCSGYAKDEVSDTNGAKPDGFLKKPFCADDFLDLISDILERNPR